MAARTTLEWVRSAPSGEGPGPLLAEGQGLLTHVLTCDVWGGEQGLEQPLTPISLCAGVRYNAEKKKVGNYYTTPIYRWVLGGAERHHTESLEWPLLSGRV